jgi:hypothetical protein
MTLWAWIAGIVGSTSASWLGATVFQSNTATAILSVGVALVWAALYWFVLDKTEIPDHTFGRSVSLTLCLTPVCVALVVLLDISQGHQLWFVLGILTAAQIYGAPTTRLHLDDAHVDND